MSRIELHQPGSYCMPPVADSVASLSQADRSSAFLQALFRPRVNYENLQPLKKKMPINLVLFKITFSLSCFNTESCRPNFTNLPIVNGEARVTTILNT